MQEKAGEEAGHKKRNENVARSSKRPPAGTGVEARGLIPEATLEEENMGHSVKGVTEPRRAKESNQWRREAASKAHSYGAGMGLRS